MDDNFLKFQNKTIQEIDADFEEEKRTHKNDEYPVQGQHQIRKLKAQLAQWIYWNNIS